MDKIIDKVKEYWQVLVGIALTIFAALFITSNKADRIKAKLVKTDKKDSEKIKKIREETSSNIREAINDHSENLEAHNKNREEILSNIEKSVESEEEGLNKLSNEELSRLLDERK